MSYNPHLRIGTRGSALALAQAAEAKERLQSACPELADTTIDIIPIKTTGDRILDKNLADIGGKGLFTKEIEEALLAGTIDMAVHSMKDMPALIPAGLDIACILPREDARDAYLSPRYPSIESLPAGAIIGTSSSRRQAQLLASRPDLVIIPFRGNVGTRLDKLQQGLADATILAIAGLKRIAMEDAAQLIIPVEQMLPAVAQGAIGIECRKNDPRTNELLRQIHHYNSAVCVSAERAFLKVLEGSCRTPIAAYAELSGNTLHLRTLIATTDGSIIHRTERKGNATDAESMGTDAGQELKARGGDHFFA